MPPNSHTIFDEGAVFMSFKLVDNGIFQEEGNVPYPLGNCCRLVVLFLEVNLGIVVY